MCAKAKCHLFLFEILFNDSLFLHSLIHCITMFVCFIFLFKNRILMQVCYYFQSVVCTYQLRRLHAPPVS